MKKGCMVALVIGVIGAVVLVVGLPAWWRSVCRAAGERFRRDAVCQIEKWSANGWAYSNVAFLVRQRERTYGEEWLSDHLISMHSGEWIVYFAECSKANPRIADIFIGKGSDGKWYYSTYHFCVGMINIMSRPKSLADFRNDYSLCEFDGEVENTYGRTEAIRPPSRTEQRMFDGGTQPGLPDLSPVQRAAAQVIPIATNSDPDLAGHDLQLHAIRYEHRFLQSDNPTGILYVGIYRDSTLRGGDATGIDIEVRDRIAYFKSQKGQPLWSCALDGEPEVAEDVLVPIALGAVTNFWPTIDSSRLVLDEIVCCDPMGGNKYYVNFRLAGPITGQVASEAYSRIEVDVTTNGMVEEKDVTWTTR